MDIKEGDYVMIKTSEDLVLYVTDVEEDGTVSGPIVGHYNFPITDIQKDEE